MGINYTPIPVGNPGVTRVHRDTFLTIIANRLKSIMMYNGLYINELAELANTHRQTVMRYRNARQLPTIFIVANVAAAMGLRFSDLIPNTVYVNDRLPEQNVEAAWLGYEEEVFELPFNPQMYNHLDSCKYMTVDQWSYDFVTRFINILNQQKYVINPYEFSMVVGQHPSTIYYILDRKRIPTLPTFVNICMGLGIDIDSMMAWDGFLWT